MKFDFDPKNPCACGKVHTTAVEHFVVEKGAIGLLPKYAKEYGAKKVFIIADINTYPIAGEAVCSVLEGEGIPCSKHIFPDRRLEPNEKAMGSLLLHYDAKCDMI